eukprot:15438728-Alexandrium_andersonii.AAC.1
MPHARVQRRWKSGRAQRKTSSALRQKLAARKGRRGKAPLWKITTTTSQSIHREPELRARRPTSRHLATSLTHAAGGWNQVLWPPAMP